MCCSFFCRNVAMPMNRQGVVCLHLISHWAWFGVLYAIGECHFSIDVNPTIIIFMMLTKSVFQLILFDYTLKILLIFLCMANAIFMHTNIRTNFGVFLFLQDLDDGVVAAEQLTSRTSSLSVQVTIDHFNQLNFLNKKR